MSPTRQRVPGFLVELPPWRQQFLTNLRDYVLRAELPHVTMTAAPAPYWSDVFVPAPLPRKALLESTTIHLIAFLAIWVFIYVFVPRRPIAAQSNAFKDTKLSYYDVSEYLPPLQSGSEPAKVAQKGEPEYSKQPIISIPVKPDNRVQTIVDPMNPRLLASEVKIPNLVVWTPVPAAVPAAAATGSRLTLPSLAPQVVAPAPVLERRNLAELALPKVPQAAIVEPPPSADALQRKIGDINIGGATPSIAAPALPVPVQRASALGDENGKTAEIAPPSSTFGPGSGKEAMGQLIALGIHPTAPTGPIDLPGGNRRGIFAATPSGRPGAPGTPDLAGGGNGPGGAGSGAGGPGSGNGANNPSGVYVGGGPVNPGAGVVAQRPSNPPQNGGRGAPSLKDLMARAAASPALTDIPREPAPGTTRTPGADPERIESSVFGPKKYYSLTINMPNLSSAAGSWIIRFAELEENNERGELTSPVATQKVDPAYPPDLMKARVEGTVTLYAVIHKDGSVSEVRVLRGIDDRLDANAMKALMRWVFRPATKNGSAVDLEAVVQIPFAIRKNALIY